MMQNKLGKIERADLETIFTRRTGARNSKVVQGPRFGVDTAIVRIGENQGLIMASDPTSLIPTLGLRESAWLSVILTANDVATSGFLPEFAQFMLHLPHTISKEDVTRYWEHIHAFCREIGVAITGGHTGFGDIGPSTISGGVTMFTQAELTRIKSAAFVRADLDLIVTKSAALSSAVLLAKCFPNHTTKHLGEQVQRELNDTFYQMSILPEIQLLRSNPMLFEGVVALHDVTEGGVLGAVYELGEAGGVGVVIDQDQIPLGSNQRAICRLFSIDPYRSVGAGSLLIACEKDSTAAIVHLFNKEGIRASKIGVTTAYKEERYLFCRGEKRALKAVDEDPYWRAYVQAITNHLE